MNFSKVNSENYNNLMGGKYPDLYQHRFCNQEEFSIVICGCENVDFDRPFLLNNFETKVYLTRFWLTNNGYKLISTFSVLYVVGHCVVKRYSYSSKVWNKISGSPYFDGCCICLFLQKLFVIKNVPKFYYKERNKWCSIANINENRLYAACTVF